VAYLLDTVALLMWWTEPDRLGRRARDLIEERQAVQHVSPVSVWEIANKDRLGKLPQVRQFATEQAALVRANGFRTLELTSDHALRAGYLPGPHRDPFDRLLAGQALVEGLAVVTNDPEIARFGCEVFW
jgi:PIN domain nuclease of toxin-antitoxin system